MKISDIKSKFEEWKNLDVLSIIKGVEELNGLDFEIDKDGICVATLNPTPVKEPFHLGAMENDEIDVDYRYNEDKTIKVIVAKKPFINWFKKELEGGYGRTFTLDLVEDVCQITGIKGLCVYFDSSDGEYSNLSVNLDFLNEWATLS